MRVVITGGAGFLGMRLARALIARGFLIDASGVRRELTSLTLLDVVAPAADGHGAVPVADPSVSQQPQLALPHAA